MWFKRLHETILYAWFRFVLTKEREQYKIKSVFRPFQQTLPPLKADAKKCNHLRLFQILGFVQDKPHF